tara:strand:- start:573 stop:866 length:294 start_codon:yes stop_codon:yes gene_type:complete
MGKIIQFPKLMNGVPSENEKARELQLQARLGELEKRVAHFSEDIQYIQECVNEDMHEMSQIIKELAVLNGYTDDEISRTELAETLQRWLEGDDNEDR